MAGGFVALVYLATTTVLADVVDLPFQVALAVGFATAVVVHFSLQRWFVWSRREGYALAFRKQVVRYLTITGVQYAGATAVTATAPHVFHVSSILVYLVWTGLTTVTNFIVFGQGVFHPRRSGAGSVSPLPDATGNVPPV